MGRRYVEPKPQIPFTIYAKGEEIRGYFIVTGDMLPTGFPDAVLVHLPHEPPMQITYIEGQWRMLKVAPEIAQSLGKWIEGHYKRNH